LDATRLVCAASMKRKRKSSSKGAEDETEKEVEAQGEEEEEEDEGNQANNDEDPKDEELDVEFEFFEPCEEDFHSVKDLLKAGTWEFVDVNFSELADSISGLGNIGSIIKSDAGGADGKTDDDRTPCGLLTALNFRQFSNVSWPKVVADALIKKAEKHADAKTIRSLQELVQPSSGTEVGLLVSERFANLPPELVPALHKSLLEDIVWSCKTPDCPKEERKFYQFTHFVGVVRCYGHSSSSSGSAAGEPPVAKKKLGKKKRKVLQSQASADSGEGIDINKVVYAQPEFEKYVEKASFSFSFPFSSNNGKKLAGGNAGMRLPEMRMVFGITRKAFDELVKELCLE